MNTYKLISHIINEFLLCNSTFSLFLHFRSLPKISSHEEEGVHQNPQYTGHHHFHPVPHDHDFCERVVINVSQGHRPRYQPIVFLFPFYFLLCNTSTSATFHFPFIYCGSHLSRNKQFVKIKMFSVLPTPGWNTEYYQIIPTYLLTILCRNRNSLAK